MKALSTGLFAVLVSSSFDFLNAIEYSQPPEKEPVKNALSFQPLGAILNSYFFNFERLIAGHHGAVFEAGYIGYYKLGVFAGGSRGAAWNLEQGYTIALHYRFHFLKKMNSPFIGVFAKYGSLGGTITETEDESKRLPSSPAQPRIGFVSTYRIFGINGGYRWVWDSGLTLVIRLGAGANSASFKYALDGYEDEKDIFKDSFRSFLIIDAEFSVGYAF